MKKICTLLVCLAMVLGTFGAFAESETELKYTVLASISAMDEYQVTCMGCLEKEMNKLGMSLTCISADQNTEKQITDVESLIVQKPDMIIIGPVNRDGVVPAIMAVYEAGIPCVIYDTQTTCDPEYFSAWIGQEDEGNGYIQAAWLTQYLLDNPDEELLIGGIMASANSNNRRYYGCLNTLQADERINDRVKVVAEKICDWDMDKAQTTMEDWIQAYPAGQMNCIIAENDSMAIGCANALLAAGANMDDWTIVGVNGDKIVVEYIAMGAVDMTSFINIPAFGKMSAELFLRIIEGEELPVDERLVFAPADEIYAAMDHTNVRQLMEEYPKWDDETMQEIFDICDDYGL